MATTKVIIKEINLNIKPQELEMILDASMVLCRGHGI